MKSRESGFTLIELLIVVVIIGILAAIAIPKFTSAREKAFISASKTDLRNLANLQELYYNENYSYGSDLDAVGFVNSDGVTVTVTEASNLGWSATASHAGLPTRLCSIYHGGATPVAPATVESVVECN
ncbi:MAG: prepilin-type N-terminal cleavage/methylation domain-containing protein [Longimicrobiales bacterium]|nr:prepilin-type N-terminal cleavage/methylation domain-containing protein [Longimicrobiales bacterium]